MALRRNPNAEPTLAQLDAKISALKDQVAEAFHAAEGRAHATHRRARHRARGMAHEMAEGGREQLHMLGDMAGRTVTEAERYARSHPAMTLGAAAAFGVVIGMLMTARH